MQNVFTVDVNALCNLSCDFCYQNLDGSELLLDEILSKIEKEQHVQIGGGEPLLYSSINDLLREIFEKKAHAHVATNATVIPDGFLTLNYAVRNNTEIQVSLHASNSSLFKEITKENKFDAVIENIIRLKGAYKTGLRCAVYEKNFEDVPNIVALASDLNLPLSVNLVFPVNKNVNILNNNQINTLRGYLFSKRFSGEKIESPLLHRNNCSVLSQYYGFDKSGVCPAECGLKQYMNPNGHMKKCEFIGE